MTEGKCLLSLPALPKLLVVGTPFNRTAWSGLISGAVQAVAFNPYDRALYLSITRNRDFLHLDNWRQPFQGFAQAFIQRTLTAGLFFPLEDFCRHLLNPLRISLTLKDLFIGKCAGALNGLILNPISVVKYRMWGSDGAGFFSTAVGIFRSDGFSPFFRGASPTVLRDITFGAVYTSLRHGLRRRFDPHQRHRVPLDILSAVCATIASSPFNFARSIQYATPQSDPLPTMIDIWKRFITTTWSKPTRLEQFRYAQKSLGVGWGTARVAVAMTLGAFIYERLTKRDRNERRKEEDGRH